MGEAELLDGLFQTIEIVLTIFSMFFAIVSGYLAALYFFLGRAPLPLRAMAFLLLTVALVFLGGSAATIQLIQDGLFASWARLGNTMVDVSSLRNPVPVPFTLAWTQQEIGTAIGWIVAVSTYAALAFLTFFYRWPKTERH